MHQRAKKYREKIRREGINEAFRTQRRGLSGCEVSQKEQEMNLSFICDNPTQPINAKQLKSLAKFSETASGTEVLVKACLFQRITPFLLLPSEREQVYLALTLLSNYLHSPLEQPPSHQFIQRVVEIADNGGARVKDPCINILRNILQNYFESKQAIVARHNLLDFLKTQFERCPVASTLIQLLQLLYFVLKQSPKMEGLKQFNKYLYQVILGTNDYRSIIVSLECIRLNLNMFSAMANEMKQGRIFDKLFAFAVFVKELRFTIKLVQCAHICILHLNENDFLAILHLLQSPWLATTLPSNLLDFKEITYRVLFDFIYHSNTCFQLLSSVKYHEIVCCLLKEFEDTQNQRIHLELAYIFSLLYYSGCKEPLRERILNALKKAEFIHAANVQFQEYISTFINQ